MSKKVLQICSYYGGSKVHEQLFQALDATGVTQTVYVFTAKGSKKMAQQGNILISPCYRRWDRYVFPWKHFKVFRDMGRRLSLDSFDAVHAHSLFSNGVLAYFMKKRWGTPYVVTVRNTDLFVFFARMPLFRPLGRRILIQADHVVFLSKAYRDHAYGTYFQERERSRLLQRTTLLPNGIDPYWHLHRGKPRTWKEGDPVGLVFSGTVTANKNPEAVMEATALLQREGVLATLRILGRMKDARYRTQIEASDFVRYVGFLSKETMRAHYAEATIFVLPSKYETFGLVYAEAMTQGLPVIYTRGQGFDGQFPEGMVGFSVNPKDPRDIAEKIQWILKDYDAISARCVSLSARFQWTDIAQSYGAIYDTIARTRNGQARDWGNDYDL